MTTRSAHAEWVGDVKGGNGSVTLGSGAFSGPYSFGSRFESAAGTNPEELIGAAHAACFSMALSLMLGNAGYTPDRIRTTAKVTIDKQGDSFAITKIELSTTAQIPSIDEATFHRLAETAKTGCPVSKALAATPITLQAQLEPAATVRK